METKSDNKGGFESVVDETVDLERIPIEEVFAQLRCTKEGLTSAEGEERLRIFGQNKLEEKSESKFLKFLGFMWNPLSWVMEAAAIMAIALANGGGKPPDWPDFIGILTLLVINSTISFIEENNAGNAAAALMARLAPMTKVLRDGKWQEKEAVILVPGDIVSIKLGDIVPADSRLLEGDPLKIDQSALTGESLPVTKKPGDEVYSGSTCKQGEIEAVVIATGVHSFFGKAAHLVDSTNQVGHFQKVLTAIGNFCIVSIAIGLLVEIVVMFAIQKRKYRDGIDNLLVLLIGGIPIAMPTVLSVTMAIGSHRLSQQGAITKRMTAIEEMAGMDVLCSDKTGTLTLNKLTVDKNLVETFTRGVDKDLPDPKEARAGIQEIHFLPFNPVDKRTAITYIDSDSGAWYRSSKGAPEEILALKFRRSPRRVPGGPWEFLGLLPLFDPPRHDSAETIRQALNLGVNVKMITGDQLAIAKETGRRKHKDESIAALPVDELIENADGFAGVFPEHKYEIVKRLQEKKHICGMTGDGVNDAPALKKADIGIAVSDATDAARSASDIVLTEPGLSVIISAVLTSRAIFQRMKNYTIYAVSITIRIVFDFSPFMVLIIAILNDGTIMTISKDRVKPSPVPDSWKLKEIFAQGVVLGNILGSYDSCLLSGLPIRPISFEGVKASLQLPYILQVSIISQALIFVTRSRSWSYIERPGSLLLGAFVVAQLVATFIAVYANWGFARISAERHGISCLNAGLPSHARRISAKENREALWAQQQRTLHGLTTARRRRRNLPELQVASKDIPDIAGEAKRRAEMARLRELNTLKGHVESVVRLKGLDIDTIQQAYTV
ncbi:hypothetical protein R1sor_007839 [Riccia sorocarpa]|uniref:P-type H(+)-exporting transporter n=1 Tax=Riccia sorocarpa TaxID=122646 RepID=A0ABD3HRN9_9MARC